MMRIKQCVVNKSNTILGNVGHADISLNSDIVPSHGSVGEYYTVDVLVVVRFFFF